MSYKNPIQIVDLFAGPERLVEGFPSHSAPHGQRFEIKVSAEMEHSPKSILRLIDFYRRLKTELPEAMDNCYYYC